MYLLDYVKNIKFAILYTQSLTTVVKLFARSVDQKDEIWAYIKACSKIGCSLRQLLIELSTAYEPSYLSYDTVRQWKIDLILV